MAGSLAAFLKDKFPSKDVKVRKLELLRDQMCSKERRASYAMTPYQDGAWDAINAIIMMVKEGEL